jgi:hypothetical protein
VEVRSNNSGQERGIVHFDGLRPLILELAELSLASLIVLAGSNSGGRRAQGAGCGFGARKKVEAGVSPNAARKRLEMDLEDEPGGAVPFVRSTLIPMPMAAEMAEQQLRMGDMEAA